MDRPPRKLPEKRDALRAFLGNHSARVFLDPRREGVMVPKWLTGQAELVLRLGYGLTPPIPDLELGADALSCTLSFKGSPFWCCVPWTAIYAVISDEEGDGQGLVWPDDVPIESHFGKPTKPKPKLAAVRSVEAAPPRRPTPIRPESGVQDDASAPKAKRPLPSYLRVVK